MKSLSHVLDINKNSDKIAVIYIDSEKKSQNVLYRELNDTLNKVINLKIDSSISYDIFLKQFSKTLTELIRRNNNVNCLFALYGKWDKKFYELLLG